LMRPLAAQGLFQGAVVIMRGGRVEHAAGFGFADIERGVAFTADTPMDGGSLAKPFTATALLMLAAEGRIDLDAPVQALLPTYPHRATRLRHLLAHSAGLPDYDWFDPPRMITTAPWNRPCAASGRINASARAASGVDDPGHGCGGAAQAESRAANRIALRFTGPGGRAITGVMSRVRDGDCARARGPASPSKNAR